LTATRVRKSAEERRDEIVGATIELAYQVGPERITTEAIARAIGVTQAAIFRHFPRKQDIWLAVVDWISERLGRRWAAAGEGGTPEARLRALVVGQFEFIRTMPALPVILFSREIQAGNNIIRESFLRLMGRFAEILAGLVEEGKASGAFRQDIDSRRAALMLIGLIQGQALRWSLSGRSFDLPAEGAAMLEMALRGLARPEPA
jgi:AcrR family transcriptional regulator